MHACRALFKSVTSVQSFGLPASNGTGTRALSLKQAGKSKIKRVPPHKPLAETLLRVPSDTSGAESGPCGGQHGKTARGEKRGPELATSGACPPQQDAGASAAALRRRGAAATGSGLQAPRVVRRGAGAAAGTGTAPPLRPPPGPEGGSGRGGAAAWAGSGCCSGRGLAAGGAERQLGPVLPTARAVLVSPLHDPRSSEFRDTLKKQRHTEETWM